jgi:HD-GYP domain-containing protein (c-di-GMP phosphodiesterase class II)
MVSNNKLALNNNLEDGEYLITDPAILDNMLFAMDIKAPDTGAVLITKKTKISAKILKQLKKRKINSVFAKYAVNNSISATIEHMEETFNIIEGILDGMDNDIGNVIQTFHNKKRLKQLENLIRDNLDDIGDLFSSNSTEKMMALTKHHNGTARHSLLASFIMMAIGRELGWIDNKLVKAALAVINHDIGKARVNQETLNWPGRLNNSQWKEIQFHTLFGCRLLYEEGKKPDLIMLSALLHHEWYSALEGKGYGGLTLYHRFVQRAMKFDVLKKVAALSDDEREIIQIIGLADMISALEESRSYKRELDSFKVLIIMNTDAKMGHFNPKMYAAWHNIYMREHTNLLPRGRRIALPREKENRIFTPLAKKAIPPTKHLTYYDLGKLGYLQILRNVGMDVERIRRRGGLSLKILKQLSKDKNLGFDFSSDILKKHKINLVKECLITEKQVIELDTWREWLTVDELEKSGLLGWAKNFHFDIDLIRKNGGIAPDRLIKRGVNISQKKLDRLGITTLKRLPIQLPGSENRVTGQDLRKLGIMDKTLEKAGCLARVNKVKSGVPLEWLIKRGVNITVSKLVKNGIDPVRKVFYDIQVVEEINTTKAKFRIIREGDDPNELDTINAKNGLESIQDLLINKIGLVEMDFADLIALPDMSHITMGDHWRGLV